MAAKLLKLALLALTCTLALAIDNNPLQDLCVADPTYGVLVNGKVCKDPMKVTANDFSFSGLHMPADTSNPQGVTPTFVTVDQLAGLNTYGISIVRFDFAPNGLLPPHFHPRGTEILTVLEGSLDVAFITSNPENRLIGKRLEKGDVFVFPEGLVHYQKNVGHKNAVAFSALSSQNPGAVIIPSALFGSKPKIPADVLAMAFQVDQNVIAGIQAKF